MGVALAAGQVVAGCGPYHAFAELMGPGDWPAGAAAAGFVRRVRRADHACGSLTINRAVDR